jgi:hypothetical protein
VVSSAATVSSKTSRVRVARSVLSSSVASSTRGVASSAVAVRVDARVSLVAEVRVVRASGVRAVRVA